MPASTILESLAQTATNFAIAAILLAVLTAIFMQALYEIGLRAYLQRRWVEDWIEHRLLKLRGKELKESQIWMFIRRLLKLLAIESKDSWMRNEAGRLVTRLEGEGRENTIYSLNYQQLCGQIAGIIQSEIDQTKSPELLEVFALGMDLEELEKLRPTKDKDTYGEDKRKTERPPTKKALIEIHDRASFYAEKGIDNLQISLGRLWRRNNYFLNLIVSIGLTVFLSLLATQFVLKFTELTWVLLSVGGAGGLFAPIASNILERVFYSR